MNIVGQKVEYTQLITKRSECCVFISSYERISHNNIHETDNDCPMPCYTRNVRHRLHHNSTIEEVESCCFSF